MFQKRLVVFGLPALLPLLVAAAPPDPAKLRDSALADAVGLDIARDLTTEIGPRPAGSEAEARARDWAVARLKALGFKNVRIEPFDVKAWQRGEERGALTLPYAQPLAVAALGYSGATPAEGIEAPVVVFESVAALESAKDADVAGRIVYVGHAMRPAQDGSSYGYFGPVRRTAPSLAAKKGAAAIVIRSLGTDSHRMPHTGTTNFEPGVTPIPAAALSNPDADLVERAAASGKPMRMRLVLTPRTLGTRPSGNVIAEIPGTDPAAGIVAIGGHLDSWDLGTGAIDNAAGVAITAAAAKRIMAAGSPRRTIRVIWFGSEEVGGVGGRAYFEAHKAEPHALVAESDFGADRVWRVQMALPAAAEPVAKRLEAALAPLGIGRGRAPANAGADLGPWVRAGSNGVDLNQDGTRYFDLHHTADDTFDKIDPAQFRQNVAAWTAMLAIVGWADEPLLNQNSLTGAR
jgi:Zn-dependent M28 family amino/carboxypeptidase